MISKKKRTKKRSRLEEEQGEESQKEEGEVWSQGNKVYFHADVTKSTVQSLLTKVGEVASTCDRVLLFIHSDGGDAFAGLSAMDHLKSMRADIWTIADGFCASSATLILLGGRRRYCMPHSIILIHQLTTGFYGKYAELVDEMKNSEKLMQVLKRVYLENASIPKKRLNELLTTECHMTAEESVQMGVSHALYPPSELV